MRQFSSTTAWTNRSVLALAGTDDPLDKITKLTRKLVLDATDMGWSGPPFDPIALCKLLKINVVPRESIRDARIVPEGNAELRIEFNPLRPRGRIRFSVAHEIAHTLFPDCADKTRNRQAKQEMELDDWQLEMLCNIAAAEIVMPAGHFERLKTEPLDVNHLMDLRREFDVSTEALFLRVVRLTDEDCVMFVASVADSPGHGSSYRIDYSLGGRNASMNIPSRLKLPANSTVGECTAIGFTAKGDEKWPGLGDIHIECVGIPPYPGHQLPRVVGIVRSRKPSIIEKTTITYLKGNALQPRGDGPHIVAHIVNDKTARWGGGIALTIAKQMPDVQADFQSWAAERPNLSLGNTRFATSPDGLEVASMVAQHGYGPSKTPRIRYQALATCLESVASHAAASNAKVHMPRIGTGNAGGDWRVISNLIDEIICSRKISVTVYDLPDGPRRG